MPQTINKTVNNATIVDREIQLGKNSGTKSVTFIIGNDKFTVRSSLKNSTRLANQLLIISKTRWNVLPSHQFPIFWNCLFHVDH